MIVVYILKNELSYKLYRIFPIEIYTGSLTCFKKLIYSGVLTISALEPVTILNTEVNQQGLLSNVIYAYMYIYIYIYILMYVYIYMRKSFIGTAMKKRNLQHDRIIKI